MRRDEYLEKLDEDKLSKDPKLCARIGMKSQQDAEPKAQMHQKAEK